MKPSRAGSPLDRQTSRLLSWADRVVAENPGRYHVPETRPVTRPTAAEAKRNQATVALYKQLFRSFLWTGFECSNPLLGSNGGRAKSAAETRWDQNEVAGLYDAGERRKQIRIMGEELGIENARIAVPNHLVVKTTPLGGIRHDWSTFDSMVEDFQHASKNGKVRASLDLMHFGLPDAFHDPKDPLRSNFLNPAWPDHFARYAVEAVKRYPEMEAITLINEPFVTNNFSGSHWNEAVGGNEAFIDRALLMGQAAVKARTGIEEHLQATKQRKIFNHNDSCEFRSDDQDFNSIRRFLTSDLILGADWLLTGDFKKSDAYAWLAKNYDQSPEGQRRLEASVEAIRKAHVDFEAKFGKSMKADTIFGMDYYVTCEAGPGITHSPDDYKNEAQKTRKGLYEMGQDYWDRYRLPLFHAETNMRGDKAKDWMTQQLVELTSLMKSGVPVLGATWYSLMDQVGWENGLNGEVLHSVDQAEKAGRLNQIGLISLRGHDPRPSAELLRELGTELRG